MLHFLPRGFVSPGLFPSMFAPHLRPPSYFSRGCSAKSCFECYQHGVSDQAQTALSGTFLFWYRLAKLVHLTLRTECDVDARQDFMSLSFKQSTFTFHTDTFIEIRIHETCLLKDWYNTHRHTYPNGVPIYACHKIKLQISVIPTCRTVQ